MRKIKAGFFTMLLMLGVVGVTTSFDAKPAAAVYTNCNYLHATTPAITPYGLIGTSSCGGYRAPGINHLNTCVKVLWTAYGVTDWVPVQGSCYAAGADAGSARTSDHAYLEAGCHTYKTFARGYEVGVGLYEEDSATLWTCA